MNDYINDYLTYLRVERGYTDLTVVTYRTALSQYEDYACSRTGTFRPLEPDLDLVRRWLVDMARRRLSAVTINKSLSALRSFYHYLRMRRLIDSDPLLLLSSLRVPHTLPAWITPGQMDYLIDEADYGDGYEGRQLRLLINLLYQTGMRRSEAARLRTRDIDFGRQVIHVMGKGQKQREVPFGSELAAAIRAYIALRDAQVGHPTERLLTNREGLPLTPQQVTLMAHKALGQLPTLTRRGAHVLRHTFATNMLSSGADLMAVKELLGHASLSSTEVYTHLTPQELISNYRQAHPRADDHALPSERR